ncbi:hypothetical protein HPT25_23695 [Bacillus sp. BRMEA1]|uniref:hypothetical protein n=1 Tax=Neobacillus endophyticus TaxID=2738405 RepID=UPI0015662DA5|nr:hypothetical protein [Neobacillus endophyticus]NRD80330.1 hypothetical protein [Neobacillus endophyticus]
MRKMDWKKEWFEIKPHHIVVACTSKPDYEMNRQILLENDHGTFVVLEGYHCSCYDFDDTEWEAIEYTNEELKILSNAEYNKNDKFWEQVRQHI